MPARLIVTARQERLGAELRILREQAGLTVRQAAQNLSIDQTKISHMEAGRVGVSEQRLRRLASHYACDDQQLVDALADLATERLKGWWESYRDVLPASFLDLAELEHHATFLRMISIVNIPGLLQTPEYARAVFAYTVPALSQADLDVRVEHRMQRQDLLSNDESSEFLAIIHEAALRILVSDRQTMRKQLEKLLELSTADRVRVQIIPFDAQDFAGAGHSLLHAGGPVPRLDTMQLDRPGGSGYLYAEAQLNKYWMTFSKVAKSSRDPQTSRELIRNLLEEM